MQSRMLKAVFKTAAIAGVLLTTGVASAQVDVYLQAERFEKTIPDGNGGSYNVPMWGFAECLDDQFNAEDCGEPSSPGPQINATVGDTVTITVNNALTNVPVSIIVPGQSGVGVPVRIAASPSRLGAPDRAGSMTHEATDGATATYSFTAGKPGTFLYQSGSYPSIEVPMGLYGALVIDPATGASCATGQASAYTDSGSCYDADRVLLFSEVDPIQNERVEAAAQIAAPTPACVSLAAYSDPSSPQFMDDGYPCTLDYNPMFLLINGEPSADLTGTSGVAQGDAVMLRMLNAGLRSHTPSIIGVEMGLVAEDGNRYPGTIVQQSAVLLAAGKTLDALIAAPADDTNLSFFDRMPTFSNESVPNGGSLGSVQVGAGDTPPIVTMQAVADMYTFDENNPLTGKNVLDNDIGLNAATVSLDTAATFGIANVNADGTFTYVAQDATFSGTDTFGYVALLDDTPYPATVTINVDFTDEPPVGRDDAYTNTFDANINVAAPGVLANDSDPDGDTLTAALGTAPANGTLSCLEDEGLQICKDGSFTYTPTTTGMDSFTYTAFDGTSSTAEVTVSLTTNPVANIALKVIDANDGEVTDYHWTVEEDTTWQPTPGVLETETLGTNFHKSYMPVIAQGVGAESFARLALDPAKHYFVSVLPRDAHKPDGHNLGGSRIMPGATAVTVHVNTLPTPFAQINIIVFNDNHPTNGAIDGGEVGLGGFQISIEDAGGRYGAASGMMSQDANGDPLTNSLDCFGDAEPPTGIIISCPDTPENQAAGLVGRVLVKNLWPGKYGVITNEPVGQTGQWTQTSTIEGSKVIDAWVKANEPEFFQEFGPPGFHVFVGFVNPGEVNAAATTGDNVVTGKVTNMHMSRPPNQTLVDSGSYESLSHTRAWVGLNSVAGEGPLVAAVEANSDGTFEILNVPDGEYQLVVWDKYLDQVIAFQGVSLPDANGGYVGTVPVFNWFTRLENRVFHDKNGDGIRQETEDPITNEDPLLEQAVILRWRDGTVYQAFPTDTDGFVPFDQVFPFFHWLVAEIDYARFEATGATITVDGGGDSTGNGVYNPLYPDGSSTTYTEEGAALTFGYQGFLGQTSIIDWGKKPWEPDSNGGISGIVYYATTRAENDPRLGVAEPWEPGVARATVRLYKDVARADGSSALVLIDETQTDSWDDSLPEDCPGAHENDKDFVGLGPTDLENAVVTTKCYDGIRAFNQIRPAVFDGGYAFDGIPAGKYVVEVVPPPGYELVKEEDVNVGYGETFGPAPVAVVLPGGAMLAATLPDAAMVAEAQSAEPGLAQPRCVGDIRTVPDYLSIFPDAMEPAPYAMADRPLCDRKEVILADQGQAAADFFLFTQGPISAHYAGMILDDTAQEFNPLSPNFGEKWAPPFVPVSVRDYTGKEISRVYADQWGRFNGLVPSTYSANEPAPSGMSPNMLLTCKNDPGPIPDPDTINGLMVDPHFNPAYGTHCFTFQYMTGATTYLDTPVMPNSAFASGYNPVDCEAPAGTPRIRQVDGDSFGPYVFQGGELTIRSHGLTTVSNPAYEGPTADGPASDQTVTRDYGFGSDEGTVTLDGTEIPATSITWGDGAITWAVSDDPDSPDYVAAGEYQLVVTSADGISTTEGITVTVADATTPAPTRVQAGGSIQAAIDDATAGDLILVGPGAYEELIIMSKPVRLQGAGAGATFISGLKRPTEALLGWREKMDCLFGIGAGCQKEVDSLPGQADGAAAMETEEGATITVLGVFDGGRGKPPENSFLRGSAPARIDGFSISGGDTGGGVFANGYAHRLEVSNNHIFGNSGSYHGGIRIGRPYLELEGNGPFGFNERVDIHHNAVTQNASFDGAGGGISISTGTDSYNISSNFVCGNFTQGDGAGIGHLGRSDNGLIADNTILFNQSFLQQTSRSGGGIFIGGEPVALAEVDGPLSLGTGDVTVQDNVIMGNHAASGHGGGIRAEFVNGQDVVGTRQTGLWFGLSLLNNTIVNNVAGWSGGGVSLQDVARSSIEGNTIARNDSTATVAATFENGADDPSIPQTAGVSSAPHSIGLTSAIPSRNNTNDFREFSNPTMTDNVIWQNRSFNYDVVDVNGTATSVLIPQLSQSTVGACDTSANYDNLGVLGGAFTLDPGNSVVTDDDAYGRNFAAPYCNGGRKLIGEPGPILPYPALDEGGATWIDVRFGPITQIGDYSQ